MGESITLYMNKQPGLQHVNKSWENSTQGKNCSAQELINFFDVYCSTGSIKVQIYLCQLYKVDMDVLHEISLAQEKCSTEPESFLLVLKLLLRHKKVGRNLLNLATLNDQNTKRAHDKS